jgi:hypothetical protein
MTPLAWALRFLDVHWGEVDVAGFSEMMWVLPEPTVLEQLEGMSLRTAAERLAGRELEPERMRDIVERFFNNDSYVAAAEGIEHKEGEERDKAFNDLVDQLVPKAVSEVLEYFLPRGTTGTKKS